MTMRVLPGDVAWYVTGRFYASADGSLFDAGYFVHLQGIDAPLFVGDPAQRGEATARLTFLADPFTSAPISNGNISLGLDSRGGFGVYLQHEPGATFDHPTSFGAGDEVARFERVGVVMGATLGSGTADHPFIAVNTFSARLVASREFEMDGGLYDLGRLIPNGVTQWGTASEQPITDAPGYKAVVPFVGSAIAIGER
jgi:hypothetical protein